MEQPLIIKYLHHGKEVFVREDLKGLHREHCLCFRCEKLNTFDHTKNCAIAKTLYSIDILLHITTPVWECPEFKEK
jgi:hypothetical protein